MLFKIFQLYIYLFVIVTVHELSHMTAASFMDTKILSMSVGIGPGIKKKIKDIDVTFSIIPFGGAVSILFEEKSKIKRSLVYLVGPLSTLILAIIYIILNISVLGYGLLLLSVIDFLPIGNRDGAKAINEFIKEEYRESFLAGCKISSEMLILYFLYVIINIFS